MSDLKSDIKQLIIDALGLEDISVSDIGDEQTLFGEGLGLDSVDALELAPSTAVGEGVYKSLDALRLRVPAAFEGLSVAGPTAAYEFHARSADGRVADASATSPSPAEVVLTVLSREGDGTADRKSVV